MQTLFSHYSLILHPVKIKLYLFVWVRAVVAEHQVGPSAVEQQVCGFEGQREALDALTEVKGVPQVVVGGVHKKVLKKKRINTLNTRLKASPGCFFTGNVDKF